MDHSDSEHLFIRVDADSRIGIGHLMRCLALAQAWKDAGGKAIFITACQNDGLLQRLRTEEFEIQPIIKPYPDNKDWDHTRAILAAHPMAWVVIDGYHFDQAYQKQVKEAGHRFLVIDDTAHLKHYYADIVLNQNLHAEKLRYSCEPHTSLLLGTRYVLLRREFLAWSDWKRDIPEVAKKVLVTLGGGDPDNYTLKVINALQDLDVPGVEAIVVAGASNPNVDVLEAAAEQSSVSIRLERNPRNMPELMAWADMAVSAGGSTAWELLFLGLPSLLLALADNQYILAKEIANRKAGQALGHIENTSTRSLCQAVAGLAKDSNLRAQISENARQIVDGKGAQRVINSIKEPIDKNLMANAKQGLTVFFLGAKQAGCIGLLTLIAAGCKIVGTIAYDSFLKELATELHIPTYLSLKQPSSTEAISQSDLLVSVHGREIVPDSLLKLPRFGGINVHPCLYRYKGANPVERLLQDACPLASVGVHLMTNKVDEGEVLAEEFVDVTGKQTVEEVYNALYPFYGIALLKALRTLII